MNSLLKLKKIIDEHFDKLNELINKNVNIIVVGGYDYHNVVYNNKKIIEDDIETWNNPEQCEYSDMLTLKKNLEAKGYKISICAIDNEYPKTKEDIDIPHYKDYFNIKDKDYFNIKDKNYLNKKAINIVVSFHNNLLPNSSWPLYRDQNENILDDNLTEIIEGYNTIYLYCHGSWNERFPDKAINYILQYDLKTPIYPYNPQSYIYMLKTTKLLNDNNIFEDMKPYLLACFSILGTPMLKGDKYSDMMRVIIGIVLKYFNNHINNNEFIINDLRKFILYYIQYNELNESTRLAICKTFYGIDGECNDTDFYNVKTTHK